MGKHGANHRNFRLTAHGRGSYWQAMGETLIIMRRRRLILNVGLVLLFIGGMLVTLVLLVLREPSFYKQSDMPEGIYRLEASNKTVEGTAKVASAILNDSGWEVEYTAEQINAFFQQHYYDHGGDDNLPAGFSAPRVKLEEGRIRVGVRYTNGSFSTILSVELKIWLSAVGTNTLVMELVSLQAGSLPLSPSTLLDYISQAARAQKIEVTWYRHNEHPVAVMRFQAESTRPTFQFEQFDLTPGKLSIKGSSTNDTLATEPIVPK
jgi:hypothetical protein